MYLFKAISILGLSIILTSPYQKTIKTLVVSHTRPEILSGQVKQLIEIRSESSSEFKLCPIDTTFFDKDGNPIETRQGTGKYSCVISKYADKYDTSGKKTETTFYDDNLRNVFKYDSVGNIIQLKHYRKFQTMQLLAESTFNYDADNNINEIVSHSFTGLLISKELLTYDDKGFVSEDDCYFRGKQLRFELFHKYISLDRQGNWTKKIDVIKYATGSAPSTDTIERKITYYN